MDTNSENVESIQIVGEGSIAGINFEPQKEVAISGFGTVAEDVEDP